MIGFVIGATLLVGAALFILLSPFRRAAAAAGEAASRRQINAAIYRDELAELERDRAEGMLSAEDYEAARAELQRRLIEDSAEESAAPAAAPAPARAAPLALGLALPIVAALLYLLLGNPAAVNPPPAERRFTAEDIERMVAGLAAKLEQEPGNLQGWAMLARSYKAMGRLDEAVQAYRRTGSLLEENADLILDYADALAAQRQGFDRDVEALVDKALKIDPAHPQGLWLRGAIAYEAKRYGQTIADWEALLKLLPPGSEGAQMLETNLAEVRERAAQAKAAKKK